jgi:hypothetical protein
MTPKLRHVAIGLGLLVVVAWLSAHLALLTLVGGLVIGYLVGRSAGQRKAVLQAAHARTLGSDGGRT